MQKVSTIKDLLNIKENWMRFLKQGFVLSTLFYFAMKLIEIAVSSVANFFKVTITSDIAASINMGGGKAIIAVLVMLALYFIMAGFLMEYIQNTRNKLIRWSQK